MCGEKKLQEKRRPQRMFNGFCRSVFPFVLSHCLGALRTAAYLGHVRALYHPEEYDAKYAVLIQPAPCSSTHISTLPPTHPHSPPPPLLNQNKPNPQGCKYHATRAVNKNRKNKRRKTYLLNRLPANPNRGYVRRKEHYRVHPQQTGGSGRGWRLK